MDYCESLGYRYDLSPTFSVDEIREMIYRVLSIKEDAVDNESLTDYLREFEMMLNVALKATIEDLKNDLLQPSNPKNGTKYFYRDYYHCFSDYEDIDRSLLEQLEASTEEPPEHSYMLDERIDFCQVVSIGAFKHAVMRALISNDPELVDKLLILVIKDAEADLLTVPSDAKKFYGRYYDVIKNCPIADAELIIKFKRMVE